eukprot:Em0020g362a
MHETTNLLLAAILVVCNVVHVGRSEPLPRASATPLNIDPSLDCSLKELAWQFARKLLPQQGEFRSAFDALQLQDCGVPLPETKARPFQNQHQQQRAVSSAPDSLYVDAVNGSDSNPGTLSQPLQSLFAAVMLLRSFRPVTTKLVTIYLLPGTYYLTNTITLGPEDSNLVIVSYADEEAVISGGKLYNLDGLWKQYVNEMGPIYPGVNAIYDSGVLPGESNYKAQYYGKVGSPGECQQACEAQSCFAYTYHDNTTGAYSQMCYFRADGLWVPTSQSGHYSGKRLTIYVADLTNQNPTPFNSFFINGRRAVRARYPDGNPETTGLHTNPTGYVSRAVRYIPRPPPPPATEIRIESPVRSGTHFPTFQVGIGGPVEVFDPPVSYWGTANPAGGGGATFQTLIGLEYSPDEWFANTTWSNPKTGVVHMFHCGHWANWQFQIEDRNMEQNLISWSYGGFQEARGCGSGAEWYIENIFEQLDAPGEWFFDEVNNLLYLYPNGSLPSAGIGTVLDELIRIVGTQDVPVINVTIVNVTFAHTATTFLEPYEVPSGGDWAIHRGGAIYAEGVDGIIIQDCMFDAPGGNGVYLSNYIRNASIEGNEFVFTGDSAIAAIGSAQLIDGTDGNQPRGTKIYSNLIHEIGVFGKQTSAYIQAIACETELVGNVIFNGPRAGINFNDGFGGGNLVMNNLAFNLVRETGDHGPFNSWDRQPFLTDISDATPSLTPAQTNITRNFIINNYHSTWPIDHDDGSCYYYDTYNFLVYGGYKNYLGHSKVVKYNVYVYPDAEHQVDKGAFFSEPYCANSDGASEIILPSGWGEVWVNNTCIIGNPNVYEFSGCIPVGSNSGLIPFTANNTFYAPGADIYIKCSSFQYTLQDWQKKGYDIGSTVNDIVPVATIIVWGKELLSL